MKVYYDPATIESKTYNKQISLAQVILTLVWNLKTAGKNENWRPAEVFFENSNSCITFENCLVTVNKEYL